VSNLGEREKGNFNILKDLEDIIGPKGKPSLAKQTLEERTIFIRGLSELEREFQNLTILRNQENLKGI
jgi:hypothetical protein